MIVSAKTHQNLSDYIQFLIEIGLNFIKKVIISSENMRNSGNYIYNYGYSFFGEDFLIQYAILLLNINTVHYTIYTKKRKKGNLLPCSSLH